VPKAKGNSSCWASKKKQKKWKKSLAKKLGGRYIGDWETIRYASNWPEIRREAHYQTSSRCCYCYLQGREPRQSRCVHHVRYKDELGAIAGREVPGVDVFPVCPDCHDLLHEPSRWLTANQGLKQVLDNRNFASVQRELRDGFERLAQPRAQYPRT